MLHYLAYVKATRVQNPLAGVAKKNCFCDLNKVATITASHVEYYTKWKHLIILNIFFKQYLLDL